MSVTLADIRLKHQKIAKSLKDIPDGDERDAAFADFAVSLVKSWDYTGEDGEILPIEGGSIAELKLVDFEEFSELLQDSLFPKVPNGNAVPSSSGSTPAETEKRPGRSHRNG